MFNLSIHRANSLLQGSMPGNPETTAMDDLTLEKLRDFVGAHYLLEVEVAHPPLPDHLLSASSWMKDGASYLKCHKKSG